MPTRGSSGIISPSIHSLFKPPFLTQLHSSLTISLLVTMVGQRTRRRRSNALPQVGHHEDLSSESNPEGWIVINEVNEDGVVEYFINVATNQTFYTREDLMRYVAYARQANLPAPADQPVGPAVRCTRCRNTGHQAPQCGFSESYVRAINALYQPPAYRRGQAHRTTYQCSRCGRYGHNARTCHGPLVPMEF